MFPWAHVSVLEPHTVIGVCPSAQGSRAGVGVGRPACGAGRAGGAGVLVHPCWAVPLRPGPQSRDELQALTCCGDGLRGSVALGAGTRGHRATLVGGWRASLLFPLESKHLVHSLVCRKGLCYMQAAMALAHSALSNKLTHSVPSQGV